MQPANNGQQPVYILQQGTQQTNGSAAQRSNISAAKAVAQAIRTTLGPLGMDKMLIDPAGNILITNDGVSILREIGIEHPAAKMVVEVAKTQEANCYDGTTSAVVLAGALLEQAERLLDKGIHPTTICKGYRAARDVAVDILKTWGVSVDESPRQAAATSLTGKSAEGIKDHLVGICVDAIKSVQSVDDINILSVSGKSEEDTCLVPGVVVEKGLASPSMVREIEDASILLLDVGLEPQKTKMEAQVQITSPDQVAQFLEQEEEAIRSMVRTIKESGATVVFTQKKIDDLALHYLTKEGIVAVGNVQKSVLESLSSLVGGRIVSSLNAAIVEEDMGYGNYRLNDSFDNDLIEITPLHARPKQQTILASGATKHVAEEMERALEDAVGVCWLASKENIVPGGGATQTYLWTQLLRHNFTDLTGRHMMAVDSFREALMAIPEAIAENAGHDPVDVRANLIQAHSESNILSCIEIENGGITDAFDAQIVEPQSLHIQAITSAVEAAVMILRIDDVISMNPEGPKNQMG